MAASFLFFAAVLSGPVKNLSAALAKAGYDPYVREKAYAPEHSLTKKIASEFLTYPLELVRWPFKQTLYFIEEKRLTAKTRYVFEKLAENGILPKLAFTHWGAEIDLVRALHIQKHVPENLVSRVWTHYGVEGIFEAGTKFGYERPDQTGFHALGNVQYDYRPDEDFYGTGADTSKGDETAFKMETSLLGGSAGYRHASGAGIDFRGSYRNINISGTTDKDDRQIGEVFPGRNFPGNSGDDIVTLGSEVSWNPGRTNNPMRSPSLISFAADFNEGVHHSKARYFKFSSKISKSFELGSPRRVLAFRLYGEHNSRLPGHTVPFHQMARLGGFGIYPHLSQTLRGYEENRFYGENAALLNLEYRYRIYQYREWTVSHVLFFDNGQTFNRVSKFQFQDFRESYGTGLRLALLNKVLLDLEIAHGDEGTYFYARNSQPF